jgi:DNA-binding LytR/AlgR family response regulator
LCPEPSITSLGGMPGSIADVARRAETGSQGQVEDGSMDSHADASEQTMKILVYSDDRGTREQVRLAVGRRPAPDLPRVEFVECATEPAVIKTLDAGGIDVAVLDGEAVPAGGIGIARQIKDEIYQSPPVLVLVGRPQDAWLATWSRAEAVASHPLDPVVVADAVARLMRERLVRLPARASGR